MTRRSCARELEIADAMLAAGGTAELTDERRQHLEADLRRLAAVHRADDVLDRFRSRRFGEERELAVEHDAVCTRRDARSRGARSDAALRPDRKVDLVHEMLQQNE